MQATQPLHRACAVKRLCNAARQLTSATSAKRHSKPLRHTITAQRLCHSSQGLPRSLCTARTPFACPKHPAPAALGTAPAPLTLLKCRAVQPKPVRLVSVGPCSPSQYVSSKAVVAVETSVRPGFVASGIHRPAALLPSQLSTLCSVHAWGGRGGKGCLQSEGRAAALVPFDVLLAHLDRSIQGYLPAEIMHQEGGA